MLPNIDHLFWLRHDKALFEAERNRIISTYIKSLPEERRTAAYAMQCKIDVARMQLSDEELLKWMANEARELTENLTNQLSFVGHKVADIKRQLDALSGE